MLYKPSDISKTIHFSCPYRARTLGEHSSGDNEAPDLGRGRGFIHIQS